MPRARKVSKPAAVRKPSWETSLQGLLAEKRTEGLAESTVTNYRVYVEAFFHRHPEAWEEDLKAALLVYMGEDVKPATYNLRLTYLKAFLGFCIDESILPEPNHLTGFKRRRAESRIVRHSPETLKALIGACDRTTFVGLRDYALVLFSLDTGIRPKEACSLLPADVDLKQAWATIRPEEAKTRQARTVFFSPTTARAVRSLMMHRHPDWPEEETPVFCSCDGNRMGKSAWRDRFRVYSRQIGTKIRPYDLRHTFALTALKNGMSAFELQMAMGHSTLEMTRRYLALVNSDIRESMRKASPVMSLLEGEHKKRKRKL